VGRGAAVVFLATSVTTLFTERAGLLAGATAFFSGLAATLRAAGRLADDLRATAFLADRLATVRRFALARADERGRPAAA
jgi:hypothetical protein